MQQSGPEGFGGVSEQLKRVMAEIQNEEQRIREAEQARLAQQAAQQAAMQRRTCPNCGVQNTEGVNFCEQCGAKLAVPASNIKCPQCGMESLPGTRFCGYCGNRLGG